MKIVLGFLHLLFSLINIEAIQNYKKKKQIVI